MNFLSVCSGIEAASVAWSPLGWKAVAFSEIEKFPCKVLAHHYPDTPNHGDMTKYHEWPDYKPNLVCGGTPCQAFSVAGLRQGLSDPRGNLTLTFLGVVARYRPEWVVWENVPGVLSDRTNAFGQFLAGLAELGYGWAYRVLDAQHFGVPQRRRRVVVVGCLGGWRNAATVLFESESLRGNSAPINPKGEVTSWDGKSTTQTLDAVLSKGQMLPEKNRFPTVAAGAKSFLPPTATRTEIARAAELITPSADVLAHLRMKNMSIANAEDSFGRVGLRRLTPLECERLQGFPDNYTAIFGDKTPDGPRYKALGNSWAVPVFRWVGERIAQVSSLD